MKVISVVGARPQFIKAAAVSRELRKKHLEVLVHTGQHYDASMSDIFFSELDISQPDFNLCVGSHSHAVQTANILREIEPVITDVGPDCMLVYGDTNSTLAAALAAVKMGVPVVHIEAGLRSYNRSMPEEINRVVVDHISSLLLCPSHQSAENLASEGIKAKVVITGDVMLDSLMWTVKNTKTTFTPPVNLEKKKYILFTLHRPSNTDNSKRLSDILDTLSEIDRRIVWPMHPRVGEIIKRNGFILPDNIIAVDPLGYGDLANTLSESYCVITDSGGLQKEAYWLGVPCFTLRSETEWIETVEEGWNSLIHNLPKDITGLIENTETPVTERNAYGSEGASVRIVNAIEEWNMEYSSAQMNEHG